MNWIAVTNKIPDRHDTKIVYGKFIGGYQISFGWYDAGTQKWFALNDLEYPDVKYWMDLPEEPRNEI